jgi:hypothetical protein
MGLWVVLLQLTLRHRPVLDRDLARPVKDDGLHGFGGHVDVIVRFSVGVTPQNKFRCSVETVGRCQCPDVLIPRIRCRSAFLSFPLICSFPRAGMSSPSAITVGRGLFFFFFFFTVQKLARVTRKTTFWWRRWPIKLGDRGELEGAFPSNTQQRQSIFGISVRFSEEGGFFCLLLCGMLRRADPRPRSAAIDAEDAKSIRDLSVNEVGRSKLFIVMLLATFFVL